jgi:hypothetical protein
MTYPTDDIPTSLERQHLVSTLDEGEPLPWGKSHNI